MINKFEKIQRNNNIEQKKIFDLISLICKNKDVNEIQNFINDEQEPNNNDYDKDKDNENKKIKKKNI